MAIASLLAVDGKLEPPGGPPVSIGTITPPPPSGPEFTYSEVHVYWDRSTAGFLALLAIGGVIAALA